jgi:hypothetical protein
MCSIYRWVCIHSQTSGAQFASLVRQRTRLLRAAGSRAAALLSLRETHACRFSAVSQLNQSRTTPSHCLISVVRAFTTARFRPLSLPRLQFTTVRVRRSGTAALTAAVARLSQSSQMGGQSFERTFSRGRPLTAAGTGRSWQWIISSAIHFCGAGRTTN